MTETEETSTVVRAQLIPLTDMNLLLPNTCIAEVIGVAEMNPVKSTPEWFLGMMDWRGVRIPVISFETMNGLPAASPTRNSRVAVLNGIRGDEKLPFYGVLAQGIPRLLALDRSAMSSLKKPAHKLTLASDQVQLGEETAVIPDQKQLETLLVKEVSKIK